MARRAAPLDLEAYFAQISRIPLLTAAEERQLGWSIINDHCEVSKARLIKANLRLVVAIARRFGGRGLSLADLIAEGNVGLIEAVSRYDPARGARFTTYATWWIKEAMRRAITGAVQPMRVPDYMLDLVTRCETVERQLAQTLGRRPTSREVTRAMGLSAMRLARITRTMRLLRTAEVARDAADRPVPVAEFCPDERTERPETTIERRDDIRWLQAFVTELDDRQAAIFRMRFGLDGREPMTLREVGEAIGVTRERIRQVEVEILCRLRDRFRRAHGEPEPNGEEPSPRCREIFAGAGPAEQATALESGL